MTIEEISHTLPNGFHDSNLVRLEVDYGESRGVLTFDIDLSTIETDSGKMRRAQLILHDLLYVAIEPPCLSQSKTQLHIADKQWISADSSNFKELKEPPKLPNPIAEVGFAHWFYSSTDNNFIYVAAKDASFSWLDEE